MTTMQRIIIAIIVLATLGLLTVSANEDLRNGILDTFQPKGSLQIITEPADEQVSVYLDGIQKGETPLEVKRLDVGKHTLKVFKEGYKEYFQEFETEAKKVTNITIKVGKAELYTQQGQNIEFALEPIKIPSPVNTPSLSSIVDDYPTIPPISINENYDFNKNTCELFVVAPNNQDIVCVINTKRHWFGFFGSINYNVEGFDQDIWLKISQKNWVKLKEFKVVKNPDPDVEVASIENIKMISWSPNSKYLALGTATQIFGADADPSSFYIFDITRRQFLEKLNDTFLGFHSILYEFSPDSQYALVNNTFPFDGSKLGVTGFGVINLDDQSFKAIDIGGECISCRSEEEVVRFTGNKEIEVVDEYIDEEIIKTNGWTITIRKP